MRATQRGIRKFMEWIDFVREAGWHKSTWPALADLWWKHHDGNGNLI